MSLTARSPFMIVLGLLVMSIWTSEHHHFMLPAPAADSHFLPSVGSNLYIMNFFKFLLISRFFTKCIYWVEKIITIILKNCGLIVKELPGALVRAWSLRQKLPVGTEHAFLLPFLSAVFRSSAVSKVVFMEYEFFSMMRIILFLLLRYSDSSWHCVCGIHKCKHRILQSSQIIACQ